MNETNRRFPRFLALAALALFVTGGVLSAQTVATDPVGFVSGSVPASSDFRFSAPMVQAPFFVGTVQLVSGSTLTVTRVNGVPNWTSNSLVYSGSGTSTYYALLGSGTKEGMSSLITANTANTVTVSLAGDTYTGVNSGDTVKIVPYWTLETLFASSTVPDGTELLAFNGKVVGVNVSSSVSYTYYAGYGWYNGGTLANDQILTPGQSVVIRNHSASSFSVVVTGAVPMNKHYELVSTLAANQPQDNAVGYLSPVPTPIGQTGIGITDQDQLLVFNNAASGFNKSSSIALTYYAGYGWYNGGTLVDSTFNLQPGFGYVLRKAQTSSPTTYLWQNKQSYLP